MFYGIRIMQEKCVDMNGMDLQELVDHLDCVTSSIASMI